MRIEDRASIICAQPRVFDTARAAMTCFNLLMLGIPAPIRIPAILAVRIARNTSQPKTFAFVVSVFMDGDPMPVVQHRFMGRSMQEAVARYQAGVAADPALCACASRGIYQGRACRVTGQMVVTS